MNRFEEIKEQYDVLKLTPKEQEYLRRIDFHNDDYVAFMDFNTNELITPNNVYSLYDFHPEYVDHFKNEAFVEGRFLTKLPLTQEVLDLTDEMLDENIIPEFERPEKEIYNSTMENMRLAYHYEMTILARVEDLVNKDTDVLKETLEQVDVNIASNTSVEEIAEEVEEVIEEQHDDQNYLEPVFEASNFDF